MPTLLPSLMPTLQSLTPHRMALANMVVACAVMGLKYLAYVLTGSVALYSDALESIVNIVTAGIAVVAIDMARRPADRHHQFGHHKAEYLAAVLEGVFIVIAALLIFHAAFDAIRSPRQLNGHWSGLLVSVLATVINGAWAWCLITFGRRERSTALVADGWHLATDVATSVAVLAGLVFVFVTGWQILDPLMAALVAGYILWSGGRIMKDSMSGLMDEAVTSDVAAKINATVTEAASGALQVHDLRTRTSGRVTFIEFHLVVPGRMSVAAAHQICDRVETALEASVPGCSVLIHVEPEAEAQAAGALILSTDEVPAHAPAVPVQPVPAKH
jgi:cation diffusion facilitator family transporter